MIANITVLMAVHNGAPYLKIAIESILDQTYRDFIFLIVDDASTDNTREIIQSYSDPRIRLIPLGKNVGQTAALNIGLHQASTPWIARMDADDYSSPTRLEEQLRMINNDPGLCCVGTFAWVFTKEPTVIEQIWTRPTTDAEIRHGLLKTPPIIHGSIVVNREALLEVGAYNERYRYSADFDMYHRLLTPDRRAANVARPLLGIRKHDQQGSRSVVGIDETIDIYLRRLSLHIHSKDESVTIREALSFFYLLRARHYLKEKKIGFPLLQAVLRAFITSPRTLIQNCSHGMKEIIKTFYHR
ncbi:MAG: glycosyltransferase [Chlamydiota bacterium]|nr:glycosyltransferase [Chlamydiota bacterium]